MTLVYSRQIWCHLVLDELENINGTKKSFKRGWTDDGV